MKLSLSCIPLSYNASEIALSHLVPSFVSARYRRAVKALEQGDEGLAKEALRRNKSSEVRAALFNF